MNTLREYIHWLTRDRSAPRPLYQLTKWDEGRVFALHSPHGKIFFLRRYVHLGTRGECFVNAVDGTLHEIDEDGWLVTE